MNFNSYIKFIFIFIICVFNSTGFSQALPTNINISRAEVISQIQIIESSEFDDNDTSFIPLALAIPSLTAATSEYLLLTFTTGYISLRLYVSLNGDLENINKLQFSPLQAFNALKEIFNTTDKATMMTLSNVDKLKEQGYTDENLEQLASSIVEKELQCKKRENNTTPDNFCPNFKKNFNRGGFYIEKVSEGWLVTDRKGKFKCCLEWDSLHCGFEIFDKKSNHKGEVGCLEDEFDPCKYNLSRGKHAKPQKDHRPRSRTCKK